MFRYRREQNDPKHRGASRRPALIRPALSAITAAALTAGMCVAGAPAASAAGATPVDLQTSAAFGVLAATTVVNNGPSVITGELGVSPGTTIIGFPPGTVSGSLHAGDSAAAQAHADAVSAFTDAAGQGPAAPVADDLAGLTLTPGIYAATGALGNSATVTLDAEGDPSAVFIVQVPGNFVTSSGSAVTLAGRASACNVYWQVSGTAALGTTSALSGTVMANLNVVAQTGATFTGRLMSMTSVVVLDSNQVILPAGCTAPTATALTPATGIAGTQITITGTEFNDAIVTVGGQPCTNLVITGTTTITCDVPAGTGSAEVVVKATGGQATLADPFVYISPPALSGISPAAGPAAGGTQVTISGANLAGAAVVIGGAGCAPVAINNAGTSLTCTTSGGAPAGAADVVVTTPGGSAALAGGFTFAAPGPSPAALTIRAGKVKGSAPHKTVTLKGTTRQKSAKVFIYRASSRHGTAILAAVTRSSGGTWKKPSVSLGSGNSAYFCARVRAAFTGPIKVPSAAKTLALRDRPAARGDAIRCP